MVDLVRSWGLVGHCLPSHYAVCASPFGRRETREIQQSLGQRKKMYKNGHIRSAYATNGGQFKMLDYLIRA